MSGISEIREAEKKKKQLIRSGNNLAKKLYREACDEIEKKGYRENMMADRRRKLQTKVAPLIQEDYQEYCKIMEYFDSLCECL